jgi:hypothetical protein
MEEPLKKDILLQLLPDKYRNLVLSNPSWDRYQAVQAVVQMEAAHRNILLTAPRQPQQPQQQTFQQAQAKGQILGKRKPISQERLDSLKTKGKIRRQQWKQRQLAKEAASNPQVAEGHTQMQGLAQGQQLGQGPKLCHICKNPKHIARDCPNRKQKQK